MLTIVSAYQGMTGYISAARKCQEPEWGRLWQQFVIEPYWQLWAAGQHNEARTRAELAHPPLDLDILERSVNALAESKVEELVRTAYKDICQHLPYHDDDTVICIMAGSSNSGDVAGTCIGGSTLLTISAAVPGWQPWLKYVLAHERHHSAWGYHYYYIQGGSRGDLLTSLISEGAADTFAHYLCPDMHPTWVSALSPEEEVQQWQVIEPLLDLPDSDGALHHRFFFGDAELGTPASTGYTIGFHILQEYWKRHPAESVADWTLKAPEVVYDESGYSAK